MAIRKLRTIKTLKQLREFLVKLTRDILQSTVFLGIHGALFMPSLCTGR